MTQSFMKKSIQSKEYREDRLLSMFVAGYFLIDTLNMSIKQLLPISESIWQMMSNGFRGLLFVFLLFSIKPVLRHKCFSFFCTEIGFLMLYLISYLMGNADTVHLLKTAFWTLGACIPLAFYVYTIRDKQMLLNILRKVGYVQGILLWATLYYTNKTSTYSMSASYALLIPMFVCLSNFFVKHNIIDMVFALVSGIVILLFGARGPLLCIVFYVIVQVCFLMKRGWLKWLLLTAGTAMVGVFVFAQDWLVNILLKLMLHFNVYSRTVMILFYGSLTDGSGRNDLFDYYGQLIFQKPFVGWGLLGGWIGPGSGPHNMLLEFLLAFGVVIGGILCIGAISLLFRFFFIPSGPLRELLVIFAACNFPKYLVAGFFLDSPQLFIFVVLCFAKYRNVPTAVSQESKLSRGRDFAS